MPSAVATRIVAHRMHSTISLFEPHGVLAARMSERSRCPVVSAVSVVEAVACRRRYRAVGEDDPGVWSACVGVGDYSRSHWANTGVIAALTAGHDGAFTTCIV